MITTSVPAKSSSIRAVVTRANGQVEDLGLIAYYHRNPVINWVVNTYIKTKDFFHDRSRPK